jgi:hypothetical protein
MSTEGREELSEGFYETLQKILDTVNNNDYMLLIGNMNARVGNNKLLCLKSLIEKRRNYNSETHLLFVEYEKAFDSIQRQALFDILKYSRYIFKGNSGHTHKHNKILIKSNSKLSKLAEINKGVV